MSDTPPAFRRPEAGQTVVLSLSGGKDSTAAALHLRELGIDFRCVHMDTQWEAPETEEYMREDIERVLGPITILRSGGGGMEDWIRRKMMFPGRARRYCTQQLKIEPVKAYLATLDDPVNVVGIRAAESEARAQMPEWEYDEELDCDVWRPVLTWALDDVIAIHRRHGVRPNPLYLAGHSRVGCYPCIYARKAEIRLVAERHPKRIDLIDSLERELTEAARDRARARAEEPWPEDLPEPTDDLRARAQMIWAELAEDRSLRRRVKAVTSQSWAVTTKLARLVGVIDSECARILCADREAQLRDPDDQYHQRTYFGQGENGRSWDNYGIRSIVDWARTGRGGRQWELFDSRPADAGCMRWGLCETADSEGWTT